jgi:hypothetical protein
MNGNPNESRHEAAPNEASLDPRAADQILAAVTGLRFGTVEVTVHEGKVVQITRTERRRMHGTA